MAAKNPWWIPWYGRQTKLLLSLPLLLISLSLLVKMNPLWPYYVLYVVQYTYVHVYTVLHTTKYSVGTSTSRPLVLLAHSRQIYVPTNIIMKRRRRIGNKGLKKNSSVLKRRDPLYFFNGWIKVKWTHYNTRQCVCLGTLHSGIFLVSIARLVVYLRRYNSRHVLLSKCVRTWMALWAEEEEEE